MSVDLTYADSPESFYVQLDDKHFAPTEATSSPWDLSSQHGGPPAALLAECIDTTCGDDGLRLARLTVDFLGPIPRREFKVSVEVVRPGKRIRQSQATITVDGRVVVRASAWHIATDSAASEVVPPAPAYDVPTLPAAQPQRYFDGMQRWGHGEAIEWRFVVGGLHLRGPAKVWTRLRVPLLPEQPLTGLTRAVMVADSTNGLSNELPLHDWLFIPPTLTVTLLRHPVGEWVYVDAHTSFANDGIGLAESTLADETGFLGSAAQPLLISPR